MIIPANARITVIPTLLKEASTPFALLYASTENNWSNVEPPTTICAFCKPTNAIKRPIPTLTADFRFIGIALKIASRTFVREIKEKTNIYSTLITSLTMAYNRSKQVSRIYLNKKLFEINSINKNEFTFYSKIQKQRIEQVWIIVINNALDELIKIEDYENRSLNIFLFEENDDVVIKFKDSAGGINQNIIENIFEPFVSSKEHSGMGVGLNIAKRIVDEQDGLIKAYNEDDGAVFEIRLKSYEEE